MPVSVQGTARAWSAARLNRCMNRRDPSIPQGFTTVKDFAASALHEAAHWCIAGKHRRARQDFGYDYLPPPRSAEDQRAFFELELRTQSLEALFAEAAGLDFIVSTDDFDAEPGPFARRVRAHLPRTRRWLRTPAGVRAAQFIAALEDHAAGAERAGG